MLFTYSSTAVVSSPLCRRPWAVARCLGLVAAADRAAADRAAADRAVADRAAADNKAPLLWNFVSSRVESSCRCTFLHSSV